LFIITINPAVLQTLSYKSADILRVESTMPSLFHPRVAPDLVSANQSASQISGFYGPGTWAAWILSLVSSIIALRKHHDNHAALNLIPPILYINWTAVDLLKQLNVEDISHELRASAAGITLWGLWYFTLVQKILGAHHDEQCVNCKLRTIRAMGVLGFIVPCIALVATLFHTDGAASNRMLPNGKHWFNSHYKFWQTNRWNMILLILNITVCCWYHVFGFYRVAVPQRQRALFKVDKFDRISGWIMAFFLSWGSMVYLVNALEYAAELRDVTDYQWSCALKPCAPQSITESDQGFALCCGLFVFVYEVGPGAINWVRRHVDAAALKDIARVALAYVKTKLSAIANRCVRPKDRADQWPRQVST
jgi:hypothetical protein